MTTTVKPQRRPAKIWHRSGPSAPRGGALVEFALAVPILLVTLLGFWDTMLLAITEVRHWSSMIQVALNVDKAPLKLQQVIDVNAGLVGISTRRLSALPVPTAGITIDELRHPSEGFLSRIRTIYQGAMDHSGTGASYFKHDVAVELWYISACTEAVGPCASRPLGTYAGASVAGDYGTTPTPVRFFHGTTPNSTPCFPPENSPAYGAAQNRFTNFVKAQIQQFSDSQTPPTDPTNPPPTYQLPVANKLLDVATGSPTIGQITEYVEYRPVVFLMACTRPPTFFRQDEPLYTFHTYFPDREVSIE